MPPPPSETQPAGRPLPGLVVALAVVVLALAWTALSEPPSRFALAENTLLRAALLGMAAMLWRGRDELAAVAGPDSRFHAELLGAIVLVGLGLRCVVEALPWHAFNWVENLAQRVVPEPEPFWYANGFGVFMRVPYALGLPVDEAIFAGNRLAGALAVPALYGLDRVLGGSSRKALWSAALLAVLPLHVQLSASESMQIVPSLFMIVGLLGFGVHARTRSRPLLYCGMLAILYGALSRPEALLVVLAVPVLYAGRARWRHLLDPALLIGCLLATVIGLPFLLQSMGYLRLDTMHPDFGGHNLKNMVSTPLEAIAHFRAGLAASGWAMEAAAGLGVAGVAVLLARGPRRQFLVVALLLALQLQLAGFENNFANRLQLQIPEWPFWLLAAAVVPATILEAIALAGARLAPAARTPMPVVASLVAVLLLAGGVVCWRAQPRGWDLQDEWRFFAEHDDVLQQAGPALPIVRFARGDDVDPAFPFFPSYRLRAEVPLYGLADVAAGKVPLPALYYRGPHCYTRYEALEFTAHHLRPRCEEVESSVRLEPIATQRLTSRSYTGKWDGNPDSIEIGFYRMSARDGTVAGAKGP